jgi:hypothetical protein
MLRDVIANTFGDVYRRHGLIGMLASAALLSVVVFAVWAWIIAMIAVGTWLQGIC